MRILQPFMKRQAFVSVFYQFFIHKYIFKFCLVMQARAQNILVRTGKKFLLFDLNVLL